MVDHMKNSFDNEQLFYDCARGVLINLSIECRCAIRVHRINCIEFKIKPIS